MPRLRSGYQVYYTPRGRPIYRGTYEYWLIERQEDWRKKKWDPQNDLPDYITTEGDSHYYKWGRVLTKAYPALLETYERGKGWVIGGFSYDKYGGNEKEYVHWFGQEGGLDYVYPHAPGHTPRGPMKVLGFTVGEWMDMIAGGADAQITVGGKVGAKVGMRVATLAEIRASMKPAAKGGAKVAPEEAKFVVREAMDVQRTQIRNAHENMLEQSVNEGTLLSDTDDLVRYEKELEENAKFWESEADGILKNRPKGVPLCKENAAKARQLLKEIRIKRFKQMEEYVDTSLENSTRLLNEAHTHNPDSYHKINTEEPKVIDILETYPEKMRVQQKKNEDIYKDLKEFDPYYKNSDNESLNMQALRLRADELRTRADEVEARVAELKEDWFIKQDAEIRQMYVDEGMSYGEYTDPMDQRVKYYLETGKTPKWETRDDYYKWLRSKADEEINVWKEKQDFETTHFVKRPERKMRDSSKPTKKTTYRGKTHDLRGKIPKQIGGSVMSGLAMGKGVVEYPNDSQLSNGGVSVGGGVLKPPSDTVVDDVVGRYVEDSPVYSALPNTNTPSQNVGDVVMYAGVETEMNMNNYILVYY